MDWSDDEEEDGMYDDDAEDDDDEDGDGAFNEPLVSKQESTFDVLEEDACRSMAQKKVVEAAELLACELDVAQQLLRHYKWDQEKMCDEYWQDPEACTKKAGVHMGADESVIASPEENGVVRIGGVAKPASSMEPIECQICFDRKADYSALQCGHAYCNVCYTEYVSHKIADEGFDCVYGRCPAEKCRVLLSTPLVTSLLSGDANRSKLTKFERASSIARSFVDDNASLKWCPGADCGRAVRARPGINSVACKCGTRFCFQCSQDDHAPTSCDDLKKWLVKCKDDSETFNWLVANTKACPKCGTSIEKNVGCNHMTCKNGACKYEFCWVCCGAWKDHSGSFYACNKYDPDKDKDNPDAKKKDSSRAALERYLHYYTRYTNHDQSLKLEMQAKTNMENKVKEMEALGTNTWMDCQYLTEANEALHECRYALKFTYVYAFYLPEKHNFRVHFEMQQMELEKQTEDLAEQLEKDVKEIDRMKIVNSFQMAKKRLRHLFEIVEQHNRAEEDAGASSSSQNE